MYSLIGFIIGTIIQGFLFWGVMKIFDRDNTRNNLPMAFLMGIILNFGIFGMVVGGIVLVTYYDMGFIEMLIFILLLGFVSWGIGRLVGMFV